MNFTNDNVVIILIIIIAFVFIFNFDVYVITKNEPICKPIYVTKKVINNEMKQITSLEKNINQEFSQFKETFSNISCNLNTPENYLTNFNVYGINSTFKKSVIDSVINVLSNIPTDMDSEQIKEIIEYFAIIYETSLNIHDFYNNVSNSTKINKDPYNTKYARLVLYLINKFDNDYSCSENLSSETNNPLQQSSETNNSLRQSSETNNSLRQSSETNNSLRQSSETNNPLQQSSETNNSLRQSSETNDSLRQSSAQELPTFSSTQQLPKISSTQETMMMQKTLSEKLPPNMINQSRMIQQASMMNLPNMQSQNSNVTNETSSTTYNGKTENIKDMINKLSVISSEGKKKCKITKPNNNYNLNSTKTENFNNIDTYNNAFMEHYASF
jgi:hypothetical protein